jgi:hypothetical protein
MAAESKGDFATARALHMLEKLIFGWNKLNRCQKNLVESKQ